MTTITGHAVTKNGVFTGIVESCLLSPFVVDYWLKQSQVTGNNYKLIPITKEQHLLLQAGKKIPL